MSNEYRLIAKCFNVIGLIKQTPCDYSSIYFFSTPLLVCGFEMCAGVPTIEVRYPLLLVRHSARLCCIPTTALKKVFSVLGLTLLYLLTLVYCVFFIK